MKDEALRKLEGKWGLSVVVVLLVGVISAAAGLIPFGSLLIGGPLTLGMAGHFLRVARSEAVDLNLVFDGFKQFGNALGAYLLMILIVALGFVLLIIPGIMAAMALSQTFNIMRDEPELGAVDALKKSHAMMDGHKMDYFLFNLSFIGWALLCILTLGLGFLVLAPYISTSNAIFYNYISGQQQQELKELGSGVTPA
jgi:uncharacterized membrane protein